MDIDPVKLQGESAERLETKKPQPVRAAVFEM